MQVSVIAPLASVPAPVRLIGNSERPGAGNGGYGCGFSSTVAPGARPKLSVQITLRRFGGGANSGGSSGFGNTEPSRLATAT